MPELEFNHVNLYKNKQGADSMLVFNLSYSDGNGDIGLSESDSLPPFNFGGGYFYNLFVTYFVKKGNVYRKILNPSTNDTIDFNQRIPRLNLSKKDKKIEGTFDLRIPASPYPGIKPDTVRFEFRIADRSLNTSPLVSSGDVILKH
ncbi:MAG: hypothetical protein H6605_03295 [Flavobacteriales bacterium]|nr:hypothetical protein [Flavobacteriales bacterium]